MGVMHLNDGSAVSKTNPLPATLSGSNAEVASTQDTQIATTAKEYLKAGGASQIEVYVESGYVRVRTDGQPLHIDYRGTYCRWFWSCMES